MSSMKRITRTMMTATALIAVGAQAGDGLQDGLSVVDGAALQRETGLRPALVPAHVRADRGAASSQPDSLYRTAREALNRGQHVRAARLFRELRNRYPESAYTGDAYYFEAFALYRTGSEENLARARDLLDAQAEAFPDAPTREDARGLQVRIRGALARQGDADAWSQVERQASEGCGEDREMRLMALSALQSMNPERALPILREVLASRDQCAAELRQGAVFILAQNDAMSDEAVEILLELAHRNPDPDPEVREAAVFWLSQVDSEEVVDALASVLETSDDPETQGRALFALSQQESRRSGEVLEAFARRSDPPSELRAQAIFWLGQQGRAEGLAFVRSLYRELESDELKGKVLFALAQAGDDEAREWLLERALDPSESPEVRKNAVFWLGRSGVSAEPLSEIYRSLDDPEVRGQVLFALSQQDSEEAVDALVEIARSEDDPELRKKAIFWLGQTDDPRVRELLLEILRDG